MKYILTFSHSRCLRVLVKVLCFKEWRFDGEKISGFHFRNDSDVSVWFGWLVVLPVEVNLNVVEFRIL